MQYKELVNRLSGILPPTLHVTHEPSFDEVNIAKTTIAFLSDQHVLYSLSELETPSACISSILQTRQFLVDQHITLNPLSSLATTLRAMQNACQKFLNRAFDREEIERYGTHRTYWASWVLISSLGELRGVFGVHLATIAAHYRLDIEGPLEYILPLADSDATLTAS